MKILVTGATGMVGQHVTALLKQRQIAFVATSSRQWDLQQNLSAEELATKFPDVTAIFHLGALVPKASQPSSDNVLFDVNVRSCMGLAKWACDKAIAMVYLSGATVYAQPFKESIYENDELAYSGVGGFYGYSKLLAENVFNYYVSQGLKLITLRASSIYGYGLTADKMIVKYLKLAANDETIVLLPPIDERINLLHASDVSLAMLNALENQAWGTFNIAYSTAYSIYDIANTCVEVVQKGRVAIEPVNQIINASKCKFSLNYDKAKTHFNFAPKVDLRSGIQLLFNQSLSV